MKFERQANVIRTLEGNKVVDTQNFKSINKAKKHSRTLKDVSVVPHKQTTHHVPGRQPFNIR